MQLVTKCHMAAQNKQRKGTQNYLEFNQTILIFVCIFLTFWKEKAILFSWFQLIISTRSVDLNIDIYFL